MPNFKEMYLLVTRSQTKAIKIMQKAQQEAEELYMSADDTVLRVFESAADEADTDDDEQD